MMLPQLSGLTIVHRLAISLLVAGGSGVGAWALLRHGFTLTSVPTAPHIDEVVGAGIVWCGSALLFWYTATALVSTVCLAVRAAGRAWRWGERVVDRAGAPLVRRLVGAGAGAVLTAGVLLSPAHAAPPPPEPAPTVTADTLSEDLTWGATAGGASSQGAGAGSDAPPAPATEAAPGTPPETPGAPPETPGTPPETPTLPASTSGTVEAPEAEGQDRADHIVSSGESLWTIAASTLPNEASDARIAAEWPRWYRANVDVIGADPDLILPGQVLDTPEHVTGTH